MGRSARLFLAAAVLCSSALAQQTKPKPESLAKLDLSAEVAATDDDGYPSALRITIRNVGGLPIDMPVLKEECSPDNGVYVESSWVPDNAGEGIGTGHGCGMGDGPTLEYRVQHEWVRLRPGEYMTITERLHWDDYEKQAPGTVEYWVEYTPPSASPAELAGQLQSGYIIPTESLKTTRSSFHIR